MAIVYLMAAALLLALGAADVRARRKRNARRRRFSQWAEFAAAGALLALSVLIWEPAITIIVPLPTVIAVALLAAVWQAGRGRR